MDKPVKTLSIYLGQTVLYKTTHNTSYIPTAGGILGPQVVIGLDLVSSVISRVLRNMLGPGTRAYIQDNMLFEVKEWVVSQHAYHPFLDFEQHVVLNVCSCARS